jgi:transcriptional regulator GlxA family with amidase domain
MLFPDRTSVLPSLGGFNCRKGQSFDREGQSDVWNRRTRNWHRALPWREVACILGLTDLFRAASTIALDQRRSGQSPLRVTHWKPIDSFDANLSCVYDSAPRGSPQPRTLIIPPTMASLPDPDIPPDIPAGVVSWVRNRHAAGATLVSLCSGAFILAETGLVDGQSVATHQGSARALAKRFPKIVVDTNQRIIDHGDIITAGGFLSCVDLGLLLVDRILGPPRSPRTDLM